jgi:large conductance mechanosensitive channel
MWKEFKAFIARGNVVDLAVAVIIGAAFGAVIKALVTDLITPLISIPGSVSFAGMSAMVRHSVFLYGDFLNALVSFLLIAVAVFLFVIKPLNALQARRNRGQAEPDPTTRQCPECLSDIPLAAKRCAFCTASVEPVAGPVTAEAG